MKLLGRPRGRCITAQATLPGAGIADHEALAIETARGSKVELDPRVQVHLVSTYAERCAPIIELMAGRPNLAVPLSESTMVTGAEIIHAIRKESAVRLSDVVMRRTPMGAMGLASDTATSAAAALAATELGWDAARTAEEVRLLREAYRPL